MASPISHSVPKAGKYKRNSNVEMNSRATKGRADGGKGKDPRVADDETFVSDSQIPLSFPSGQRLTP